MYEKKDSCVCVLERSNRVHANGAQECQRAARGGVKHWEDACVGFCPSCS